MNRWLVSGLVGVTLVAGAAMMSAQPREITRVVVDPASLPLTVRPTYNLPFQRDGIYQVYLNAPMFFPGMGMRQRLFILVMNMRGDGWIDVEYADDLNEQGSPRAELINPALLDVQQVPVLPLQLTLRDATIASTSPRLNVDTQAARYWPSSSQ